MKQEKNNDYEYEDDESFFIKGRRFLLKSALTVGIGLGIMTLGEKSYEAGFQFSNGNSSKSNAEKDYEEWVELLDSLTISSNRDLSKRIFNAAYIDVGVDALYHEFNQKLMTVTTKEELGAVVEDYLQAYITRGNQELQAEKVTFDKEGNIYYNDQLLELDADAVCVLGNALEDLNGSASIEETVKSVIITELYETKESDGKKLVLEPLKRDLGY